MASVAVAGAGIAGLVAAHQLTKLGFDVTVFEASHRAGGEIWSERSDGYLVELGPNTIQSRGPVLEALIDELGLAPELVEARPEAKKRYIVKAGKPLPIPTGPLSFVSSTLFSPAAKLRILREPFNRDAPSSDEESVADFAQRRFGQEILDYAVNPFIAGIYAGDPEELSIRHTFPSLYELEKAHGSLIGGQFKRMGARKDKAGPRRRRGRMFSFENGLEILPRALAGRLGNKVHYGAPLVSVQHSEDGWNLTVGGNGAAAEHPFDALLLAIPLHRFAEVEVETWMDLTPLREVVYAPVSVVALGYQADAVAHPLDGFGMLVPARESQFQILGTLFSSTLFAGRAPDGHVLLTSFVGGQRHPHLTRLGDEELVGIVHRDLSRLLGIKSEAAFAQVAHWSHAIPQYRKGYGLVRQTMERLEQEHPGLYLAGSFRSGVSVGDTASSAIRAAEALAKHLT
ncbi:MAG TPA: protoporphyrinogen oxidase [Rhodothermales bacterium]|nr:protoporphyrinogen oxidase [Rhodothermales bacterium]